MFDSTDLDWTARTRERVVCVTVSAVLLADVVIIRRHAVLWLYTTAGFEPLLYSALGKIPFLIVLMCLG